MEPAFDYMLIVSIIVTWISSLLGSAMTMYKTSDWSNPIKILIIALFLGLGGASSYFSYHQSTSLAEFNWGMTTGGRSVCYLEFIHKSDNTFNMAANLYGKYPLRNVEARIVDIKHIDITKTGLRRMENAKALTPIGNIPDQSPITLPDELELEKREMRRFDFQFFADNGSWNEINVLTPKNDKWVQRITLSRMKQGKAVVICEFPEMECIEADKFGEENK